MNIDMWYGDKPEEATKIDIYFSDTDFVYRGNIYIGKKCVGDYTVENVKQLEKAFPHLKFIFD